MVGICFTDVMIHSSVSYHQQHALEAVTEPRRLYKKVVAACGAVMLHFHGEVVICDLFCHVFGCPAE